jgi:hypothetical protein
MFVTVEGVAYDVRPTSEAGYDVWRERDEVHVGSFAIAGDGTITYHGWFAHEVSAKTLARIAETFRADLGIGAA